LIMAVTFHINGRYDSNFIESVYGVSRDAVRLNAYSVRLGEDKNERCQIYGSTSIPWVRPVNPSQAYSMASIYDIAGIYANGI
jgi:hypothetical protein